MRLLVSGGTKTLSRLAPEYGPLLGGLLNPRSGNSGAFYERLGLPFGADNDAFNGFCPDRYLAMIKRVRRSPNLLWVTAPDVVGSAAETAKLWAEWSPRLAGLPLAYVAQDGLIALPTGRYVCLFVGGTTEYKLSPTVRRLCHEAAAAGKMVHMGRVNSLKRMRIARDFRVNTIDGTCFSRFGDTHLENFLRGMRAELAQPGLF